MPSSLGVPSRDAPFALSSCRRRPTFFPRRPATPARPTTYLDPRPQDAPTTFGNVYLSPEEFETAFDLTVYRRLRRELGAEDAFPPIETKVVVYDASKPVLGRIPLWRLEREGLLAPLKRAAAVTAVTAAAGIALLVAGYRHDDGVAGVLRDCTDSLRAAADSLWTTVSGGAGAPAAEHSASS